MINRPPNQHPYTTHTHIPPGTHFSKLAKTKMETTRARKSAKLQGSDFEGGVGGGPFRSAETFDPGVIEQGDDEGEEDAICSLILVVTIRPSTQIRCGASPPALAVGAQSAVHVFRHLMAGDGGLLVQANVGPANGVEELVDTLQVFFGDHLQDGYLM